MLRRPKLSKIEVVALKEEEEERRSCFISLFNDGFKVKS
jgi:hypothetical protein